jgi:hypothetical protein
MRASREGVVRRFVLGLVLALAITALTGCREDGVWYDPDNPEAVVHGEAEEEHGGAEEEAEGEHGGAEAEAEEATPGDH